MSWSGAGEIFNPGQRHLREEMDRKQIEAKIPGNEGHGETQVDLAGDSGQRNLHGIVEARRDVVRPAEVLARPARKDRDLRFGAGDPVDDLVERPVATDHDEQPALGGCGARKLRQMPGRLRQELVAVEPELAGACA